MTGRHRLVNLYISLEKREISPYLWNGKTDFHEIWHSTAKMGLSSALAVNNLSFEKLRWRIDTAFEWLVTHPNYY